MAISCIIQTVSDTKINIFFGAPQCVEVVKSFGAKPLNEYSIEQNFILGIMLGYDRLQQCNRYLNYAEKAMVANRTHVEIQHV